MFFFEAVWVEPAEEVKCFASYSFYVGFVRNSVCFRKYYFARNDLFIIREQSQLKNLARIFRVIHKC